MIPEEMDLSSEVVGYLLLVELETSADVTLRLVLGEEGRFTDINGVEWIGSKLITVSEIDFSIGGDAPVFQIALSYTQDPEEDDLVAQVREYGVEAIRFLPARFYLQYVGKHEEFFAPVFAPVLLTQRRMLNLSYTFEGPKERQISVSIEGPFNLRSKAVNGRYTDADQRRRFDGDPSFEFMPTNDFQEEALFGL